MSELSSLKKEKQDYEESIEELEYVLAHKDLFEYKNGEVKTRLAVSEKLKGRMKCVSSLESFFGVCEDLLRYWKIDLKHIEENIENLSSEFFVKAEKFKKYLETLFNRVWMSEKSSYLEVDYSINYILEMTVNKNYFSVKIDQDDIKSVKDLEKTNKTIKILIDNADSIKEFIIKEFKIKDIRL